MKKDLYTVKLFDEHRRTGLTEARPGVHQVILVLDHLKPDFNVGKILRSAEIFGVQEVHLVGIPFFDPIPAKGTLKKVVTKFYNTIDESFADLKMQGHTIFVMDMKRSVNLVNVTLPMKSAFVMGSEGAGHTFDSNDYSFLEKIYIPQFGVTESLNVSVAASIALYEYVRQHASFR